MKILSWNVNGLRSIDKKETLALAIKTYDPDIVCLQEIKCDEATAHTILRQYATYEYVIVHASTCKKGGYAGVAIMSRIRIIPSPNRMKSKAFEEEGRLIIGKLDNNVSLICCYTPNSKPRLERLKERVTDWEPTFKRLIRSVAAANERIILVGDLNVAPEDIDIFNPKGHSKSPGFTNEERGAFRTLLHDLHLVDGFRYLHPNATDVYTYWSYLGKARDRNKGWRIDHGIISDSLVKHLAQFRVLDTVLGSDHCPVFLEIISTLD
jgi:exodeoxyribonuclease III